MTIKDIEERTGMDRANIRFYEKEGLLSPVRLTNGYRDYSDHDADILLRIKLLRSLHMPLEEIRALQHGEKTLEEAMQTHLHTLEAEAHAVHAAENVCRTMQQDKASYETLDADKYLTQLQNEPQAQQHTYLSVPAEDTAPPPAHPWRRYLARTLDYNLYILPWELLFLLVFRVNPNTQLGSIVSSVSSVLAFVLMIFIEPVFLHFFGTTPGKWIFGLHLTNADGTNLTYEEGLQRTWGVIMLGYGFNIPIYSLYRLWKCYKRCIMGEEEDWDDYPHSRLYTIRDTKLWRGVAWFCAATAFALITAGAAKLSALPPNRGELTIAEFTENFNYTRNYYAPDLGTEYTYTLAENGEWQTTAGEYGAQIYVNESPALRNPVPIEYFTDANGNLTGFRIANKDGDYWELMDLGDFELAALAFITAQPSHGLFSDSAETVINCMNSDLTNTKFTECGVTVSLTYEFTEEKVTYDFTVTKDPQP